MNLIIAPCGAVVNAVLTAPGYREFLGSLSKEGQEAVQQGIAQTREELRVLEQAGFAPFAPYFHQEIFMERLRKKHGQRSSFH